MLFKYSTIPYREIYIWNGLFVTYFSAALLNNAVITFTSKVKYIFDRYSRAYIVIIQYFVPFHVSGPLSYNRSEFRELHWVLKFYWSLNACEAIPARWKLFSRFCLWLSLCKIGTSNLFSYLPHYLFVYRYRY
jgi:hypothetical protein